MLTGCAASETASQEEPIASEENTTSTLETLPKAETTDEAATEEPVQQDKSDDSSVLIAYFSATGNTQGVVDQLADELQADVFEITPAQPYTEADLNWRDDQSRVSLEHNDESLQNIELVQVTPDNFDSYDTILLGYPIWWGNASWVMNNFVSGNDFSGKTVIPFCTSSSSDLGESATLLADKAGTGEWLPGHRFSSHPDQQEVTEWLETLPL